MTVVINPATNPPPAKSAPPPPIMPPNKPPNIRLKIVAVRTPNTVVPAVKFAKLIMFTLFIFSFIVFQVTRAEHPPEDDTLRNLFFPYNKYKK